MNIRAQWIFFRKGISKLPVFLFGFIGFLLFGCDLSSEKSEMTPEPSSLYFIDSSNGLPSAGQWRQNLAFYDMNLDGNLDILAGPRRLAPPEENRPAVWYGNGKGEWSVADFVDVPPSFRGNYGSIVASDFNGDGIPDIALAMHVIGLRALKGTGDGKYLEFSEGMPSAKKYPTRALIYGDFDNDGISDIAAVSEFVPKTAFNSYGGLLKGSFKKSTWVCKRIGNKKETAGLLADQMAVGDVNGDGNLDLGVASCNSTRDLIVWIGDGKGNFEPFNKGLPMKKHYNSVVFADVNQDGRDELIASISGVGESFKGLKVFESGPDGFRDQSEGLPSGKDWSYFASAGDLDGDGSVEIVAVTKKSGLEVYGRKEGAWRKLRTLGLPESGLYRVYGLYCVDVNADGLKDIAAIYANATENSGGIKVFLSEANGQRKAQ